MTDDLLESTYNSIQSQLNGDPRVSYILDTFRCIAYTYITNLRIWLKLAKVRQSVSDVTNPYVRANITSGWLYNHMFVSGQFNASPTEIEITDEEFEHICYVFVQAALKEPRLERIIKNISDPRDAMFDLCHIFFIPIRLLASSIPHSVKLISLRKWINTVFVLPFITKYVQQFEHTITSINDLNNHYKQFQDDINLNNGANIVNKFVTMITPENITNAFICVGSASNNSIKFVRLSMNLLLFASIDIIKHYCPNFHECHTRNKEFDGSWITMFDPYHMKHIDKLNDLQQYIKI